ncbi:(4Fe-4S)-binding protein [Nonomuraea sp. NPDC003804]
MVLDPDPAAEHHAAVRRAVQSCPSGALSVIA